MSPINAAISPATADTGELNERPALRLVPPSGASPNPPEANYDLDTGGPLAGGAESFGFSDDETSVAGSCVRFLDDWSGISARDAMLISFDAPVAVPVGLDVAELETAAEGSGQAAAVDISVGVVLRHLRYVEPLRARAVRLRYGLGGERRHTLSEIGERVCVPPATAARYVREGLGELRLRIALSQGNEAA